MARDGGTASSRPRLSLFGQTAVRLNVRLVLGNRLSDGWPPRDPGIDEPCRGDRSARCRLSLIVGRNRGDLMAVSAWLTR